MRGNERSRRKLHKQTPRLFGRVWIFRYRLRRKAKSRGHALTRGWYTMRHTSAIPPGMSEQSLSPQMIIKSRPGDSFSQDKT